MKIAIIVAAFPPRWLGGTEVATYSIAKHLAKRGYEVHVITSLDKGLPKESMEEGFYVHRMKTKEASIFGAVSFCVESIALIKKINPDILHSQSLLRTGLTCFIAKKLLRKPYISYCRGSDIYLPWRFKRVVSRSVLKNANVVVSLTEDMKGEIQRIYNRDVCVIPNGIDLPRFQNLPTKESIRSRLRLDNDEKIILFVGTLRPVKGLKYLIQAMDIVRQKETKVRLMVVGDGEERQSLEELVKKLGLEGYIRFMGRVPNEKVPEYMAASDVSVLPSLSEGFPVTIPEAMASGLPIIATRVGGVPEIITNGENGLLVEPSSPEQIAQAVLTILENDKLATKISMNNRSKVRQYSWQNTAQRLEEIYAKVAKTN